MSQGGSAALQELVDALRKKGVKGHLESWALINANRRETSVHGPIVGLTPAQLQQRCNLHLGLDLDISKAEALIQMGDLGLDGKLGFNSWASLLGNDLNPNAANVGSPRDSPRNVVSNRPKSAALKPDHPKPCRPASANSVCANPSSAKPKKSVVQAKPTHSICDDGSVEAYLDAELNGVIGLPNVKAQLRKFVRNIQLDQRRRELGLLPPVSEGEPYDMVFYGQPGTGKTSIARLIPKLLERIGVIKPGSPFVEVGRQDLVGQFIGSTEERTQKKIEEAHGGVLFIDEAYTLTEGSGGRDFGIKALETIMQCMTSNINSRPIFIFAGYQAQMESFLLANPGMARRIAYKFHFEVSCVFSRIFLACRAGAACRNLLLWQRLQFLCFIYVL